MAFCTVELPKVYEVRNYVYLVGTDQVLTACQSEQVQLNGLVEEADADQI